MTGPDGELIPPQAGSTQDVCAPPERPGTALVRAVERGPPERAAELGFSLERMTRFELVTLTLARPRYPSASSATGR